MATPHPGTDGLTEVQRRAALARFQILRPYLAEGVPLVVGQAVSPAMRVDDLRAGLGDGRLRGGLRDESQRGARLRIDPPGSRVGDQYDVVASRALKAALLL